MILIKINKFYYILILIFVNIKLDSLTILIIIKLHQINLKTLKKLKNVYNSNCNKERQNATQITKCNTKRHISKDTLANGPTCWYHHCHINRWAHKLTANGPTCWCHHCHISRWAHLLTSSLPCQQRRHHHC